MGRFRVQDIIIIGGSFAGLTAALQLGRASQKIVVIEADRPRNRMSPAAHGVPGWDGTAPREILNRFQADLVAYPTVTLQSGTVTAVSGTSDDFMVTLDAGNSLQARRILLAHGVRDVLPDIPGAAESWGKGLLHCPYCHGYEIRQRPMAVLVTHPMSAHQAHLLRANWSDDITLLTGCPGMTDQPALHTDGFSAEPRTITGFQPAKCSITVTFADGDVAVFAAVFVASGFDHHGTPAEMLGCATTQGPVGPFVRIGPMGQTSVPGVFAAGDCARPAHNVVAAIGDGATAGIGCHQSLVFPEFVQPIEAAA